jgi:hypothetical protein
MYKLSDTIISEHYDLTRFKEQTIKFLNESYQYNAKVAKNTKKRGLEYLTELGKKYENAKSE